MTILMKVKRSPRRTITITVTRMLCLTILWDGSVWSCELTESETEPETVAGEFLQGSQSKLSPSGAEVFQLSSTSRMSSLR